MGRTTKPCPGRGEVNRYRKADAVCDGCVALMADGRHLGIGTLSPGAQGWAFDSSGAQ